MQAGASVFANASESAECTVSCCGPEEQYGIRIIKYLQITDYRLQIGPTKGAPGAYLHIISPHGSKNTTTVLHMIA
jgi:hypothetical protein